MKKIMVWIMMTAGLLLLVSCEPESGVGPIEIPKSEYTPTPIVVPTCTPTATPTPDPAMLPTATPTKEAQKGETAAPTPAEAVTEAPTATPTQEPTPEPTATPTPEPTSTPVPEPTATAVPEPTATPVPTATVAPSPSPTPVVDPKPLVANGWQKTISIEEAYLIIFPELFRESTVSKTGSELMVAYTCAEDSAIQFSVIYNLQQTLEEKAAELPLTDESILEGTLADKRMVCRWQEDGTIYHGILLEGQYPQSLLGSAFGDGEWITGVMQVVFSYPADRSAEYETAEYSYYVIENGEE